MKYLSYLLYILIIVVLIIFISSAYEVFLCKKENLKIAKNCPKPKEKNFFIKLFIMFPRRFVRDIFIRSDYEFRESGFQLFVGEQGSGKTITLVYMLLRFQKQYPKLVVRTNMLYKYEDGSIKNWNDLVFKNNGIYGQIDVIDEVQNWFNSLQSANFPPEMFAEITQQRKQKKCILGTSQVWGRVAKPIREQVSIVYKPITVFGCLTFVRKYKPCVKDDGSIDKLQPRGMFFFVHNNTIRNAFDTYKKIQVQSLKGYKSQNEQIRSSVVLPIGSDTRPIFDKLKNNVK